MYSDTTLLKQEKKRVFLSFSSDDLDHVRGLRLLKDNPNFELEFYDESIKEAIDSNNAEYLKRVIRDQIRRSSVTVCLISETTHQSRWVDWELQTSLEEGNKIIAMAIKDLKSALLPKLIKERGITFWDWDPEYLGRLIDES
ncbi:TIR domain-containing protein [Patescibacteria group bacterium]|nr:TIR domain-containing protein [Patescibacteria group bacterium]